MEFIFKNILISPKGTIKDILITIIPNIISVLTGIITTILLARGLNSKGMGEYALILSVSSLVPLLSDMGINQSAIRFAAKAASQNMTDLQHSVLRWAFRIRMLLLALIITAIVLIAPFIAGKIWHIPKLTNIIRLSLLISIFTTLSAIPTLYFQSLKRFKINSIISICQTIIIFMGIIFVAVQGNWSLNNVIGVNIIAAAIGCFIFFMFVPKSIFYSSTEILKSFKSSLITFWQLPKNEAAISIGGSNVYSFTFYMLLHSIIVTIMLNLDIWFIGYYLNPDQVGIYSVATRYTLPLTFILNGFYTVLLPKISAVVSKEEAIKFLKETLRLCFFIAIGFFIYSLIVPLSTPFLFGNAFKKCTFLAQLLCMRYCISLLLCPIWLIAYNYGFAKKIVFINLIQLVGVSVLNVALLPLIGPVASAIALIVIEFMGLILIGFFFWLRGYSTIISRFTQRIQGDPDC